MSTASKWTFAGMTVVVLLLFGLKTTMWFVVGGAIARLLSE